MAVPDGPEMTITCNTAHALYMLNN